MTSRAPLVAAGVALLTVGLAPGAKSWCGIPGEPADLYLRWCYSDIPPLFFAEHLHVGAIPYLDHPVEYPVLTGVLMWVAATVSSTAAGFFRATVALLGAAAAITAGLLARDVGSARALVFAAAPTSRSR